MESLSIQRVRYWIEKGGLAVLDQGLFSGANFLVNILLARWLDPKEYGAFAVAVSIYYLLLNLHTAALSEPMMVFGAGKYREHFRKYLGMLLYGHCGLSALIAMLLGVGALAMHFVGSDPMAQALAGLAIASPFLLLLLLTRRACYVHMQPLSAVAGSAANLVVAVGGALLLWREGLLSGLSGLVLLGAAAGVASLMLLLRLRPQLARFAGNPTPAMVRADHWGYGTWSFLGVLAYWASGQVLMLLIPVFLGLTASAAVAAVWNLYRPISLFIQSLGMVLLPAFSRWISDGMVPVEIKRRVLGCALLFGGLAFLYAILLTIAARPVLHLLYRGKYDEHWLLVGLFGVSTTASIVTGVFIILLKARGDIRSVAVVWGYSAVLIILFGLPLLLFLGLEGALLAFSMSYILVALWAFLIFRRDQIYE